MSFSALETLPDEILMLIFQYSGNAINILRTFLGLNQRLNNILLDRRLHLLTDNLLLKPLQMHYNTDEFQQVTSQLLSVRTSITEEELSEMIRPLLCYSIRQRYNQVAEQFRLLREKFVTVRQAFCENALRQVDEQIKTEFSLLQTSPVTLATVQRIEELVLRQGARLEYDNYELTGYNLASAINDWILCHITQNKAQSKQSMQLYSRIIQIILISNPDLLDNRGYVGNGGCTVDYFLLYTLFHLQFFYGTVPTGFVNFPCFQTTLNLFFLALCCRSRTDQNRHRLQLEVLYILNIIARQPNDSPIQIAQLETVKLVFEHVDIQSFSADELEYRVPSAVRELVKIQRLDILKYFSRQILFQDVLNTPIYIRECLNMITRNRTSRQLFPLMMKDPSTADLFAQHHLLFILLDKREHKFLKELLRISPNLVNQFDEQGNDPLLYITLNVSGCRHRIIELLINKGCGTERKNAKGQDFRNGLHLPRNRKLLKKLIEHEIIK